LPSPPLAGGEGGTHRGFSRKPAGLTRGEGEGEGEVGARWCCCAPHLTPTLSAPEGGEGEFESASVCAADELGKLCVYLAACAGGVIGTAVKSRIFHVPPSRTSTPV